jgi:hypothetical protein
MNSEFLQSRLACISFACLIAGWMLFWFFTNSGMWHHSGTWWTEASTMALILFAPAAALLAIAGLIFDSRKKVALVSLLLSLASILLFFSIGG